MQLQALLTIGQWMLKQVMITQKQAVIQAQQQFFSNLMFQYQ